ncbi:MAG: ssDNA-binding protein [Sphingomicrobium sp.]
MGKSVTGERLIIPEARLAFFDGFEAKSVDGGEAKFGSTFIIAPSSPAIALVRAEEERLAKLAWGDKAGAILEMIRAGNNQALKPGALKAKFDGFQGNLFIAAHSKVRPTIVDRKGVTITAKDGVMYSGCYALAHISLWTQDNQYGQKINANLLGLQFLRDGDAFSGGPAPSRAEDFQPLDADDEDPMG